MPKYLTTEDWIERFRNVHGDRYQYGDFEKIGKNMIVTITCSEHGDFKKALSKHWSGGQGCRQCSRPISVDKSQLKFSRHEYSDAEMAHIRSTFHDKPVEVIMEGVSDSLTWQKVVARAHSMGLTRLRQVDMDWTTSDGRKMTSYTNEEAEYLVASYATKPKEEIASHLGRSWRAICKKARHLGLTRPNIRTHQLAPLLDFSNVKNSYWLGFIMADGFISTKGDLIVRLHEKDRAHLVALSEHIGGGHQINLQRQGRIAALCAMDKINGVALREALGITEVKTYNPPASLDFLRDKDHRLAFALGFSDGDGSVHYDHNGTFKSLRIIVHGSWYPLLDRFFATLSEDFDELNFSVNNTNARGNTSVYMGTKRSHKFIMEFGTFHDLPLMERKWRTL